MIGYTDAMNAVARFELMKYFSSVSEEGRGLIAEEIMAMVNERPYNSVRKNGLGEIIPYVDPQYRLARLMRAIRGVGEWPGMGQVRALYCLMYAPADGIPGEACMIAVIPDDGSVAALEGRHQNQPAFLPAPDDEPIGEDFKAKLLTAANTMRGGK